MRSKSISRKCFDRQCRKAISDFPRFADGVQHPTFPGIPPLTLCPTTETATNISVFHSATAVFCAPSDLSGVDCLYRETIRCSPRWQTGGIVAHRRDCIILNTGSDEPGMRGLDIARVHLFFQGWRRSIFVRTCSPVLQTL